MKRIALGRAAERADDRLEALLEVAAEARAGEQRAGVEREDLRVLQQLRHVVVEQPRGEAFGHRGLADAGLADEHRVVLAAPAEHFDRALQLRGAADERIELALARALGQVRGSRPRADRATWPGPRRRRPPWHRRPSPGAAAPSVGGTFEMPCEMYSRTSSRVMPWLCEQLRRVRSSAAAGWPRGCRRPALPPRCALCTCSTAVCSTRRNAAVCSGSRSWPRLSCSTDSLEVLVELAAQPRQIGAAAAAECARRRGRAPARRAGARA